MDWRRISLIALAIGAASPAPAGDARERQSAPLPDAARRSYGQNYADIALAVCVGEAYAAEPGARKDALASAGGVDTWSNYDLERAGPALTGLVKRTLARTYRSFQGPSVRLALMKCLDMYHGRELAEQIRRFVPSPNRTYQDDNPP